MAKDITRHGRREVAERLRGVTEEELQYVFLEEILNSAVGGRCFDDEGDIDNGLILNRLADLIDPTCHMVDTDHEYEDSIRCDVCQMTFNRPWEPFKFCPNCGARVV